MTKQQPYCKECGSTNVTQDAIARWDVNAQAWLISCELDNTDCDDCGGECRIKWADLPEAETSDYLRPLVPTT